MKVKIQIITPEKIFLEKEIDMIVMPGVNGEFGVVYNHINFATILLAGLIKLYHNEQVVDELYVENGFVEVNDNIVIILTDYVNYLDKIDVTIVKEQLHKYQQEVEQSNSEANILEINKKIAICKKKIEIVGKKSI